MRIRKKMCPFPSIFRDLRIISVYYTVRNMIREKFNCIRFKFYFIGARTEEVRYM